jgi:hypothetical protein
MSTWEHGLSPRSYVECLTMLSSSPCAFLHGEARHGYHAKDAYVYGGFDVRDDIRGICPEAAFYTEAAFYLFDDVVAYPLAAYIVWICTVIQTMLTDAHPCKPINISLCKYIMPGIFSQLCP